MELEEATLADIANELKTRPGRWCLVYAEPMDDGIADVLFSDEQSKDAITLLGHAISFLRQLPD